MLRIGMALHQQNPPIASEEARISFTVTTSVPWYCRHCVFTASLEMINTKKTRYASGTTRMQSRSLGPGMSSPLVKDPDMGTVTHL